MINTKYSEYGVTCNPASIQEGKRVRLSYDGILARNGADRVFAWLGYGRNTNWENVSMIEMERIGEHKFQSDFIAARSDNLNVVFKDSADHWDNNNGQNYVFQGREGKM